MTIGANYDAQAQSEPDKAVRRLSQERGDSALDFQLTHEQFDELTSQDCTYCGTTDHIGIDHIDSGLGYRLGNVQSCCSMCNRMASNFGKAAFVKQVERTYSHLALA